jgi:hypothetical protein
MSPCELKMLKLYPADKLCLTRLTILPILINTHLTRNVPTLAPHASAGEVPLKNLILPINLRDDAQPFETVREIG